MPDKPGHIDSHGNARMVDVSDKEPGRRTATASVSVTLNQEAFALAKSNTGKRRGFDGREDRRNSGGEKNFRTYSTLPSVDAGCG